MTVDAATISAFEGARDNLLLALLDPSSLFSDHADTTLHLGSSAVLNPPQETLLQHIIYLEQIHTLLVDSARKLEAAANNLFTHQRYIQSSSSVSRAPVGRLPPEILRLIFRFAAGDSRDSYTIISESQVCSTWRDVALATRDLFTRIDWEWPTQMIDLWLNRARGATQDLVLRSAAALRLFPDSAEAPLINDYELAYELRARLATALTSSRKCYIYAEPQAVGTDIILWLSRMSSPSLSDLELDLGLCDQEPRLNIDSGRFPSLQRLTCSGFFPSFRGSCPPALHQLAIQKVFLLDWRRFIPELTGYRSLTHLSIGSLYDILQDARPQPPSRVILESLSLIRATDFSQGDVFHQALERLLAPAANRLEIQCNTFGEFQTLLWANVSACMPALSTLSLEVLTERDGHDALDELLPETLKLKAARSPHNFRGSCGVLPGAHIIIVGASGYVGTELIRQSLQHSNIVSVIAITRKPMTLASSMLPEHASKLWNVVTKDYDQYSPEMREAFAGASACIWTVAITPSKSLTYKWSEVVRVCQTAPLVGLQAMTEAEPSTPFRYLFMSGYGAERDQSKPPPRMAQYLLMRGETENQLLAFAKEQPGVEVIVAKPAYIPAPESLLRSIAGVIIRWSGEPTISRADIVLAMLDQVVNGSEKDTLTNADLQAVADHLKATSAATEE
ncbi:hypothetical protein DL93DRAFT_2169193 [Clavulina sp. PMI_390]|nr:hypothetical protein DL93DRAFT_2169193 [Clavulina sp. PMI_390]